MATEKKSGFQIMKNFVEATLRQIERLDSTDSLYAFWSRNSAAFGKLRIGTEHGDNLSNVNSQMP